MKYLSNEFTLLEKRMKMETAVAVSKNRRERKGREQQHPSSISTTYGNDDANFIRDTQTHRRGFLRISSSFITSFFPFFFFFTN